ncbi:MAG: biotin transporter BioY [bacterium]
MENVLLGKWLQVRYAFFHWRQELSSTKKLFLALSMAGVTGLMAQIYIPLPFTPVPITGQVFGALLSGVICGGLFGAISQGIYVCLGILGLPWFAGAKGGLNIIGDPTIGYLIGFIFSAFIIGKLTDRKIGNRKFLSQFGLMIIGVIIIYGFGAMGLAVVIHSGLKETLIKGVLPFIGVDLIKSCFAAGISSSILPKASYNEEVDKDLYSSNKY